MPFAGFRDAYSVRHNFPTAPKSFLSSNSDGDLTEVGEKGISLSGGQKQRINIARALYFGSKVTLFDDPLSALDAHVAKDVFENVMQTELSGTTRIIVTHALHFLPYMDYIITVNNGMIVEEGTYTNLMAKKGAFARFIEEFGSNGSHEDTDKKRVAAKVDEVVHDGKKAEGNKDIPNKKVMQVEDRNVGAVSYRSKIAYRPSFGVPYS